MVKPANLFPLLKTNNCMQTCSRFTWVVFFIFSITASPVFSQSAATLPPAAQDAVKKGIMATQLPDYALAIRYFEEARKLAPQSPEVFFNLGLAESKIPGRELRAICWFGAYLSVNPAAANKPAVKEQMDLLFIKSQSNSLALIRNVQDADAQISFSHRPSVALLWAKAGDIGTAQKTAALIPDDVSRSSALKDIAILQLNSGDIEGAKVTAALISFLSYRCEAQTRIADAQVKAKDIAGAKLTLEASLKSAYLISGDIWLSYKCNALEAIARVQLKCLDTAGARATLAAAQKAADAYDYVAKNYLQRSIAKVQIDAGDKAGARDVMLSAQQFVERNMTDANGRSSDLTDIGRVLAMTGDFNNAQKAIADAQKASQLIQDANNKANKQKLTDYARKDIAEYQFKAGDFSGAMGMIDDIRTADIKSNAYNMIAEFQLFAAQERTKNGDLEGALNGLTASLKTGDLLPEGFERGYILYRIAGAFLDIGKILLAGGDQERVKKTLDWAQKTIGKGGASKDLIEWGIADLSFALADTQIIRNDISGVQKNLREVSNLQDIIQDPFYLNRVQQLLVEKLVKINDISGARKVTDLIRDGDTRNRALKTIAVAAAEHNDIENARAVIELMQQPDLKCRAETEIAGAQIKAKDLVSAGKSLALARSYVNLIKDTSAKLRAVYSLALSQLNAGDTSAANAGFLLAMDLAEHIADRYQKVSWFSGIAGYLFSVNNTGGANTSLARAKDAAKELELSARELWYKVSARIQIAEPQLKMDRNEGKKTFQEAEQLALLAEDTANFNVLWKMVAEAEQKAGLPVADRPVPERAFAKMAKDGQQKKAALWINWLDESRNPGLNRMPFLDIATHLKSLPATDPQKYFEALAATADEITWAQMQIEIMMKQIQ